MSILSKSDIIQELLLNLLSNLSSPLNKIRIITLNIFIIINKLSSLILSNEEKQNNNNNNNNQFNMNDELILACIAVEESPLSAIESKHITKMLENLKLYYEKSLKSKVIEEIDENIQINSNEKEDETMNKTKKKKFKNKISRITFSSMNIIDKKILINYLLGTLHIKFSPVQPSTIQILSLMANTNINDFELIWLILFPLIEKYFKLPSRNEELLIKQTKDEEDLIDNIHNDEMLIVDQQGISQMMNLYIQSRLEVLKDTNSILEKNKKTQIKLPEKLLHNDNDNNNNNNNFEDLEIIIRDDFEEDDDKIMLSYSSSYTDKLFSVLISIAHLVERHSRQFIPFFLNFINSFKSNLNNSSKYKFDMTTYDININSISYQNKIDENIIDNMTKKRNQ